MGIVIEHGHEEEQTKKKKERMNEEGVIRKCLRDVRGVRVVEGWIVKAIGGRGGQVRGLWCGIERSRTCSGGT